MVYSVSPEKSTVVTVSGAVPETVVFVLTHAQYSSGVVGISGCTDKVTLDGSISSFPNISES